jgi:hypothetical protein
MRPTVLACIVVGLGSVSCKGTLEAIDLPRDLSIVVKGDMSQDTDDGGPPPSTVTMFPDVAGNIQNDIDTNNCALAGCHLAGSLGSGATMSLTPKPTTATAMNANYMQIMAEIAPGTPAAMTTLMITVGGGGTPAHTGGDLISAASTPPDTYNRWVAWITAGAPEGATQ